MQTGRNFEVSIATAGGSEKLANLNLAGIDAYVDFYNVMTYDFHGGWENQTVYQAAMTGDTNNYDVTTSVSVFEAAGVELNKLDVGRSGLYPCLGQGCGWRNFWLLTIRHLG